MKHAMKLGLAAALAVVGATGGAFAQAGTKTLDAVKARGTLKCGVSLGLSGFSQPDDKGGWTGFDVEFCRAVAAAVLGDPTKVTFRGTNATERFTALSSGEVDVLSRNTTRTMSRDTQLGIIFAGVNFYDGQGFMVKKSLGVKSAKELKGASVCVQTGTTTELNLADYFRANKMEYKPVVFDNADAVRTAYDAGRCDAFTTDRSGLYAERLKLTKPDDSIVLPEVISKEPLGPAVRQGDDQWLTIVRWVGYAMLDAEELGVTQANVDEMKKSTAPDVRRLLGAEGDFGTKIGLDNDWVGRIIKGVGNYGESYERNVGTGSRLLIARGLNNLWNNGGIQYPMPVR